MQTNTASSPAVAFLTLGCKTNLLESSALAEQFRALGWFVVPEDASADLYVFNTCTVTEKADAESRRLIRRAKRANPNARIAVTGCYAQVAPDTVAGIEGVDFVIGNNYKEQLVDILLNRFPDYRAENGLGPLIQVDEFDKSRVLEQTAASNAGLERTRGSLKIQDGCDYKCTYCIIWKGRGPSRSLPVGQVLSKIEGLRDEGFKDITLTGINIGQYLFTDESGRRFELPELLEAICELPGTFRVRLTSLDPLEVPERLIDVVARSNGRIAPHFHLSTQSADDEVLKRMARRHHVAAFRHVCEEIARQMPDALISGDIIVGFPGETEEAFENTFRVLSQVPMAALHVFRYSPRPGTPAAEFDQQVPERIRKERAQRLIALAAEKNRAFRERMVGKTLSVLVEREPEVSETPMTPKPRLEGTSENYLKVWLPAQAVTPEGEPIRTNDLVAVRVTGLVSETHGVEAVEGVVERILAR
jgi:threonylcarbamoyladenosine tRNA methylthiotransferase MtaB